MGYTVSGVQTGRVVWMRAALVAVVLAWVAAAVAVQCWLPALHSHTAHPNHPLVTTLGGEFAINLDHAHLTDKSKLPCPKQFATAVLPRWWRSRPSRACLPTSSWRPGAVRPPPPFPFVPVKTC